MTHDLQLELVRQANAAADPAEFWAYVISAASGFAQEHIGSIPTSLLLMHAAKEVEAEAQGEGMH